MQLAEIKDLIKIILSFSDKTEYKNLAPVCKEWRDIINLLKKQDFLKWCPEFLLPSELKYIWIDIMGQQKLVPKMDYSCKIDQASYDKVHIDFHIEKMGMKIYIYQTKTFTENDILYYQCYVKCQRCQYCNSLPHVNIYHDCNHKYIDNYEPANDYIMARLPLDFTNSKCSISVVFNDKMLHLISIKNEKIIDWINENTNSEQKAALLALIS